MTPDEQKALIEIDQAACTAIRDVVVDLIKLLQPTTRQLMTEAVNGAMSHISTRLDRAQAFDAMQVEKPKETQP